MYLYVCIYGLLSLFWSEESASKVCKSIYIHTHRDGFRNTYTNYGNLTPKQNKKKVHTNMFANPDQLHGLQVLLTSIFGFLSTGPPKKLVYATRLNQEYLQYTAIVLGSSTDNIERIQFGQMCRSWNLSALANMCVRSFPPPLILEWKICPHHF